MAAHPALRPMAPLVALAVEEVVLEVPVWLFDEPIDVVMEGVDDDGPVVPEADNDDD